MIHKIESLKYTTFNGYNNKFEQNLSGPNGWLLFVACNAGTDFALQVKKRYEEKYAEENGEKTIEIPFFGTPDEPLTRIFSDSETCPRLPRHVAGANAYVFQNVHENISPFTVNDNIQQLLQVVRTLKTHRANTITVVLPYSPYSRQDKPSFMKREAALASLFADQLKIAGADICLTYHPHTLALYGFYEPDIKFVALSALDLFENIFKYMINDDEVIIVSTDAGGAKVTVHFSGIMETSYAISSKFRKGKDMSSILGVIGDFNNKRKAIIIDDETVTGSSIINTTKELYTRNLVEEIYVAVTHFKISDGNIEKFIEAHEKYGLKELHVTNSIPQPEKFTALDFISVHNIADVFSATINKLHYNESVSEIFSRL